MDRAPLKVEVVAADRRVWSGDVVNIIARTTEGDIGVLPGHEPLMAGLVSIPEVQPGDTVFWHTDICHAVADRHAGTEYASVIYIGSAPDCPKNRAYLPIQRNAFLAGRSAPDCRRPPSAMRTSRPWISRCRPASSAAWTGRCAPAERPATTPDSRPLTVFAKIRPSQRHPSDGNHPGFLSETQQWVGGRAVKCTRL